MGVPEYRGCIVWSCGVWGSWSVGVAECSFFVFSDSSDRFAETVMTTQTSRALILVNRISLYPLHQWRIEDTQSIVPSARESRG